MMSTWAANVRGLWNFISNKGTSDEGSNRRKTAPYSVPDEEDIDKRKAALQRKPAAHSDLGLVTTATQIEP